MVVSITRGRRRPAALIPSKEEVPVMVVCNLRIDFVSGPVPGQLLAVVQMVTPDGQLIATDSPQAVAAGKSLTVGPVQILVGLPSQVIVTPPPAKGLTAGQAAAALAAAGS